MNRNQDGDQECRSVQGWVFRQKSSRGSKAGGSPTPVSDSVRFCLIRNLKQWQVLGFSPKTPSQDSLSLNLKRPNILTCYYLLSKALSSFTQRPSEPKLARSITFLLQMWSLVGELKFPIVWEKLVFQFCGLFLIGLSLESTINFLLWLSSILSRDSDNRALDIVLSN